MLNFQLKGSYQDSTGYTWDYYGDDTKADSFYIVPRPQFVTLASGKPSFQITSYQLDQQKTGAQNGSGFCRFDIELSVPSDIEAAITKQIPTAFPQAKAPYLFLTMDYNPDSRAYFEFVSGGAPITFSTPVSNFGSNVASFNLPMTKEQLDTIEGAFATSGGAYQVDYHLSVKARLPAVTAHLSFDSTIAYQYQVSQPRYNSWGNQISPRSVTKLLNESSSSKVEITWGTTNPSTALREAVANWANNTLSDLITTEVQKTIQLQGLNSDNSFNINDVSSFNSTYSENTVINWLIAPTAALPSFNSLNLKIADFVNTVNEQQQQMSVAVHLPFSSDGSSGNPAPAPTLPGGKVAQALVKDVTVKVSYPGIPEADATYTFTKNGNHVFTTAYDVKAGPNWTLNYTVNYEDTAMEAVSGRKSNIESAAYTLEVEAAGILTVDFEASQAFASESTPPTEINIAFNYVSSNSDSPSISRELTIKNTDATKAASITSFVPFPINSTYNYQVTYVYDKSAQYIASLIQNANGPKQIIPAANAVHACPVIVYVPAESAGTDPIFDATVNMWYQGTPKVPPGAKTLPTKAAPATFDIVPASNATGALFGRETFVGVINGDQPLVYTATISSAQGQTEIPETLLNNSQPSLMVSPTQRYFTLEITPAAINWPSATFNSAEVLVDITLAQGSAATQVTTQPSQQVFTWNKGETGSKYLTVSIQAGNEVTYNWKVNYIIPGQTVQHEADKHQSDLILNIPAKPSA
ncbi:hypothetical protein [Shewanella sp. YLB-07]|uniref:hypothetical protein n=1 Tax=Shewanella sp. YLB-07 TaxID=2601268 RepID=UPI00128E2629|nr:hypothetical protein [Shewanella sp. YLB-07]MPY24511.1 hypothetical protein [Shewanella sp. YLB-07]